MIVGSSAESRNKDIQIKPPLLIYIAIALIGVMVTAIVAYGYYMGHRANQFDESLVDASREIGLEAAAGMLGFEDNVKNQRTENSTAIWQEVDQALWYLKTRLRHKGLLEGDDPESDAFAVGSRFNAVRSKLAVLKKGTLDYLQAGAPDAEPLDSVREAYLGFITAVEQLESALVRIQTRGLHRRFDFVETFVIAISILMFVVIGLSYRRFERQRTSHLIRLRQSNEKLAKEMDVRLKAEQELQQIQEILEEKVEERTSELERINAELTEQIYQRVRAVKHLINSKAMLQAIFDGISDPLMLLDKNLRIKMMNQSAFKYYGVDRPSEVVGKMCRQIVAKNCICDECKIPLSIFKGMTTTFERSGLMDPMRIEQVTIYPVFHESDQPSDAIIRISDITEAKLLQKRLLLSEKMASLGILVSSIAHEINNPNNFISFNIPILREYLTGLIPAIDTYAENLAEGELFNMPYAEFKKDLFKLLDNMEHGAQRISAFVLNLRELSQSREFKPNSWISLETIIEKAVEICRNKLKRTVQSFMVDIEEDIPKVYTEPAALEQILINLLINAAQAVDKESSWVRLKVGRAAEDAADLAIEISDNGCGMDENTRRRIFEPFFTTKPMGEGTGLGLYVCQNIADGIGARIDVRSEPGVGTTFKVLIPEKAPPANSNAHDREVE